MFECKIQPTRFKSRRGFGRSATDIRVWLQIRRTEVQLDDIAWPILYGISSTEGL